MAEKTKDKIKKVALSLFANNGYDSTSMEQIAAGVGIKKSSLYSFISSKEKLFWEIYENLEIKYRNRIDQFLAESETMPASERLYHLFKQYICCSSSSSTQIVEDRAFWNRVLFFPPTALKEKLLTRAFNNEMIYGEKYKELIKEGIQQGLIREASPEDILLSYYSLRQGLYSLMSTFMVDVPEEQKLDHIDKVWHDYWQGIKGR